MHELRYGKGSWSVSEKDSIGRVDVRQNELGMRRGKDEIESAFMLLLFWRATTIYNKVRYTCFITCRLALV